MIITTELAQPIVEQVMDVVDYNINIMNHDGIIVASGDPDRMHQPHQGAKEVVQQKHERIVHVTESNRMVGTKPGVNLPIEFHGNIIGTVGITGNPDHVYKTARIVKITVEALLQQQYLSDRLYYEQRALEEWAFDLINPDFTDIAGLEARSHYFKINIQNLCTALVIQLTDFVKEDGDYKRTQQEEARVRQLLNDACPNAIFTVHSGKGRFIMAAPVGERDELQESLAIARHIHRKLLAGNCPNLIGAGFAYRGVEGWRSSYAEALQSLDILRRIDPQKGVAHLSEWGILQLVSQIPERTRETYLSRWLKNKKPLDPETLLTLETFLDSDQNIAETTDKLHIHRNTLLYRLDKVKQAWGLDPKTFGDAVHLQLLRLCLKLRPDQPAE